MPYFSSITSTTIKEILLGMWLFVLWLILTLKKFDVCFRTCEIQSAINFSHTSQLYKCISYVSSLKHNSFTMFWLNISNSSFWINLDKHVEQINSYIFSSTYSVIVRSYSRYSTFLVWMTWTGRIVTFSKI